MADKSSLGRIHHFLIKMDRVSAWVLLFLMVLFIISGYSMTAEYGMKNIMNKRLATQIHLALSEPLVLFFAVHCSIRIYFALRRWGIIGGGNG